MQIDYELDYCGLPWILMPQKSKVEQVLKMLLDPRTRVQQEVDFSLQLHQLADLKYADIVEEPKIQQELLTN